jgi:DMSO/TMAO reductase YedYZ heme-binding membrane subunit
MKKIVDIFFSFATKHRNHLVTLLKVFFVVQGFIIILGLRLPVRQLGNLAGELAIIFYILTLIPGIVRRFGAFYKPVAILMIFRRYIGIAMFLFVLMHALFNWFFPPVGFVLYGFIALVMLFFLFVTSNDMSTKLLGSMWGWIHKLTYIIMWPVMIHVALLKSNWTIPIGVTVIAELASFVRVWMKKVKNN